MDSGTSAASDHPDSVPVVPPANSLVSMPPERVRTGLRSAPEEDRRVLGGGPEAGVAGDLPGCTEVHPFPLHPHASGETRLGRAG